MNDGDEVRPAGPGLDGKTALAVWNRLRSEVASWTLQPAYACVYGPPGSDRISVLLVQEPLSFSQASAWMRQVDALRAMALIAAGIRLQVTEMLSTEWAALGRRSPQYRQMTRDAIRIASTP
jgi:hypothetical protein